METLWTTPVTMNHLRIQIDHVNINSTLKQLYRKRFTRNHHKSIQ